MSKTMKNTVFTVVLKGLEAENCEHSKSFTVFYIVIIVIAFVVVR